MEDQATLPAAAGLRPTRAGSGFTLVELLLAMALSSLILVSAAAFLSNVSELYFTEQNKPAYDMHARNVTRFLDQIFYHVTQTPSENSGKQTNNKKKSSPSTSSIVWANLPGDTLGEKDHLAFEYEKNIAIIYREEGPLPAITAWLHHEPDEGLFLLWQTNRQKREDPDEYRRTLISPYVKEMHFEYYDADTDEWDDDEMSLQTDKPLPNIIRFIFEWSEEQTYETIILLPAVLSGAPLY